jgi:uncharacterized protein YjiS (DUF1127 family)
MHNLHCCHAPKAIFNRAGGAYLGINKNERTRTETTMNLIRNYRNWRLYRETVTELNRLSNRELNDLGIARASIREVARKAI